MVLKCYELLHFTSVNFSALLFGPKSQTQFKVKINSAQFRAKLLKERRGEKRFFSSLNDLKSSLMSHLQHISFDFDFFFMDGWMRLVLHWMSYTVGFCRGSGIQSKDFFM